MEPYKSYEEMLEKFAKDFCKETPRMQEESGVMFYERILKLVKKVDDAAFDRFLDGRKNELFSVSSKITPKCFEDPLEMQAFIKQVSRDAEVMTTHDPAYAKKEIKEVVITLYK